GGGLIAGGSSTSIIGEARRAGPRERPVLLLHGALTRPRPPPHEACNGPTPRIPAPPDRLAAAPPPRPARRGGLGAEPPGGGADPAADRGGCFAPAVAEAVRGQQGAGGLGGAPPRDPQRVPAAGAPAGAARVDGLPPAGAPAPGHPGPGGQGGRGGRHRRRE